MTKEQNKPENTQSPAPPNQSSAQSALPKINTPEDAKQEFIRIKTALVGPEPEWCLPRVNEKAKANSSAPPLDDSVLRKSCA